jgi:hypothetical protein
VLTAGHRFAAGRPPVVRALATGLLTTLLPCGWLYAFVISAAGTGSPAFGALTMAVFWVGTVPILVTLGAGLRAITGALGRRLPTVTAAAVVVVGLATIVMRATELAPTSLSPDDPALCGTPVTLPAAHASSVGQ